MITGQLRSRFRKTPAIPVVSGDPVDVPVGKWITQGGDDANMALVGIPFDGGTVVPSRKGAAGGPAAVRESLGELNCYNVSLDVDFSRRLKGIDLGDIPVDYSDSVTAIHDRVSDTMADVIKAGPIAVSLGGDDSLCFASARALCKAKTGKIGVIGFDAHLDMRVLYNPESSSGSSYRRLFDELNGQIEPRNVVHVGVNGFFAAKEYGDYARDKGVTVIPGDAVHERGIADVMDEAFQRAGDGVDAIYFNFDMDVLDQHYAPGKVMRNPGGLTGRQAYAAARRAGQDPRVLYFACNEVNPKKDVSNFTALVGAHVVGFFWAGLAERLA
jgi:formimidoylglutamase